MTWRRRPPDPSQAGREQQHDYLTALLEVTRQAIAAGQSKDEASKLETLPGFAEYVPVGPRFTLATVIGIAYDELTSK